LRNIAGLKGRSPAAFDLESILVSANILLDNMEGIRNDYAHAVGLEAYAFFPKFIKMTETWQTISRRGA
jgi:hypothetical protein